MNDPYNDPQLRHAMERIAPPPPDVDAAYTRVQKGMRKARRRRGAMWVVSGASILTLIAAAATALPKDDTSNQLVPQATDHPTSLDDPSSSLDPSTTAEGQNDSASTSTVVEGGEDQGDDGGGDGGGDGPGAGSVDAGSGAAGSAEGTTTTSAEHPGDATTTTQHHRETTTTTTSPGTGDGTTTTTVHHDEATTTTTTTTTEHHEDGTTTTSAAPTIFETCASPGGSIRVKLQGGSFSLVSTSHPDGWDLDQWEKHDNAEIDATFVNNHDGQWHVIARVVSGAITCQAIDESDASLSAGGDS